jgi:hypothetical protein
MLVRMPHLLDHETPLYHCVRDRVRNAPGADNARDANGEHVLAPLEWHYCDDFPPGHRRTRGLCCL